LLFLLPRVGFFDFSLFVLLPYVFYGLSKRYLNEISIELFLWCVLIALAAVAFAAYGQVSPIIIGKPIRQLFLLIAFLGLFASSRDPLDLIGSAFIFSAVLNVIILYLQYFNIEIGFDIGHTYHADFNMDENVAFRKPGLMPGYLSAAAMSLYAIALIFYKLTKKFSINYIILLIILLPSFVMTSRTFMYAFIVYIIIMSVFGDNRARSMQIVLFSVMIVGAGLLSGISFNLINDDTIGVAFDLFINVTNGDGFTNDSTDNLFESLKYMPNAQTLLIGNGLFNLTDIGTNIDSGYQQKIFGGGLFYSVILYIIFAIYFIRTIKWSPPPIRGLFVGLFLILLVTEIKGGMIFSKNIGDISAIFFAYAIHRKLKKSKALPIVGS
jgi:hypothetical protein